MIAMAISGIVVIIGGLSVLLALGLCKAAAAGDRLMEEAIAAEREEREAA